MKAASEALIKNLYRENAMMATAWYDLTSRLQSNHVVLQRRQDAPKSWLNKQRQMVNATPRRWTRDRMVWKPDDEMICVYLEMGWMGSLALRGWIGELHRAEHIYKVSI